MTIIVAALTAKDGVVIAADTQTSAGWEKLRADRSKLWVADKRYAIGGAGDVRAGQVIRHFTDWPAYRTDEDTDLESFLVKRVVPAIRKSTEGAGVMHAHNGIETHHAQLIFAWADHLAVVWGNGAVLVPHDGRAAIGSGYAEALGFLGNAGAWTKADVIEAARRAAISARGVAGPFDVLTTKSLTVESVTE